MRINIIVLIFLLTLGCKSEQISTEKTPFKSLSFGFETSLEDWVSLGGGGERNDDDDILISAETMSQGDYSCKFTVSPTSFPISGGNRAELTFDQNAIQGDETWYEYSFYIPLDYKDVVLNDNTGLVNWQVISQWHRQPILAEGEDWNSYTGENESPPIAVYYNYFSVVDSNFQNLLQDPLTDSIHGFNPNWNEASTISIIYGGSSIAISKINKGEWIRLKFNIKWSESNDGFIQVWKNGNELTNGKVFGANMLNKVSHYFKFGLYRNPTIPHTNSLYFDDIRIWEN